MNPYSGTPTSHKRFLVAILAVLTLALALPAAGVGSASTPATPATAARATTDDGAHDFDWELGTWRTDVRVLADPLSETDDEWLRFRGRSVVRPLMDGRANVVELDVSGDAGRIEALNLRLYEPQDDAWTSTFVNIRDGLLTPSVRGGFHRGVGEFYGQDQLGGRPIEVRFLVYRQGPDRARFEQAYSDDGGATWETNWIAIDRRVRH